MTPSGAAMTAPASKIPAHSSLFMTYPAEISKLKCAEMIFAQCRFEPEQL